ncbi:DNA mismatch repair protein MutS [Bacteroidetes bacterium endosymbiont of Geopemphigus sp.]|uniref:DNA mismatch repair protein MutS n=1 Tax=Bacteroidetes bacterium endosymbiont of Geopemphigus sp. TaxID=2047937 RepID=UPI000CD26282|nr:DNA mismatch repair protein MutS [Bacteroidetes bacterium endosymbiont of Geopemphigus sp.]
MKSQSTPLMKQYAEIKVSHPDTLLLFRVGDFYETFDDDAVKCSKTLNIVLTRRSNGALSQTKLAGFPHHALDNYLPKLVRAGFRVAICDQLEDPKKTKSIVKRGITSIVTPGVSLNDQVLQATSNNFLAALHLDKEKAGLALLDISTGEFLATEGALSYIHQLIRRFYPSEVLYAKQKKNEFEAFIGKDYFSYAMEDWTFEYKTAYEKLTRHFQTRSLKGFGVEPLKCAITAAGAILIYLENTQHHKIYHLSSLSRIDESQHVWMDDFTLRSLEVLHSNHPNGLSLFDVLDRTLTPMGSRLLRRWLMLPLKEVSSIKERHDLLEALRVSSDLSFDISERLRSVCDMERLSSKVITEKISPRELICLGRSLESICSIKQTLSLSTRGQALKNFSQGFPDFKNLYEHIIKVLHMDPPHHLVKGNVIASGFCKELDELRRLIFSGKDHLQTIAQGEKERSGIQSLKISFNNVFGYYIEIRNIHKEKVPSHWIRKQTLSNAERYVTHELKDYERDILGAEEKILSLETDLFQQLTAKVGEHIEILQKGARSLAHLDVILSFSKSALEDQYVRPELNESQNIFIEQGRHPVIEKSLPIGTAYVPNDLSIDSELTQVLIITGPNMAGKSAFLRQSALIALMAQIGSYVPAKRMQMGLIDKIFSRVGASDHLSLGESTFMVEMNETAGILNNLSERSLIILDEIGRGTSTYDGVSIAWAVAEYLHEHFMRPKTLFATHYHELNKMTLSFPRIKNFNVSVKELEDKILFMHKIIPGASAHSFGIHVAKMAGIPSKVLHRAQELLKDLEASQSSGLQGESKEKTISKDLQMSFFQLENPLLEKLRSEIMDLDVNTLTPLQALTELDKMKKIFTKSFEK